MEKYVEAFLSLAVLQMIKTYKEKQEGYIKRVFSIDIGAYMQSLQKQGIVDKESILDVGCGPGEWTFAAAKLNPDASVIGIDINELLLDFAMKYKRENNIKNCNFLKESHENLLNIFQPESFDVIMCNGVIMYLNEKKALQIFSRLLKEGGTLIMFWNHGPGYYLWKIFSGIRNLNLGDTIYWAEIYTNTLRERILNTSSTDHLVTLGYLRKISKEVGIVLTLIETEPKLKYKDKFLGLVYVFSCKGIKIKKNL